MRKIGLYLSFIRGYLTFVFWLTTECNCTRPLHIAIKMIKLAEYTHELLDLFNMIGNITRQEQVLKFWNSSRPSIQCEIWRNRLNSELSFMEESSWASGNYQNHRKCCWKTRLSAWTDLPSLWCRLGSWWKFQRQATTSWWICASGDLWVSLPIPWQIMRENP